MAPVCPIRIELDYASKDSVSTNPGVHEQKIAVKVETLRRIVNRSSEEMSTYFRNEIFVALLPTSKITSVFPKKCYEPGF